MEAGEGLEERGGGGGWHGLSLRLRGWKLVALRLSISCVCNSVLSVLGLGFRLCISFVNNSVRRR